MVSTDLKKVLELLLVVYFGTMYHHISYLNYCACCKSVTSIYLPETCISSVFHLYEYFLLVDYKMNYSWIDSIEFLVLVYVFIVAFNNLPCLHKDLNN